jgi:tRNA(Arg) A34 adenosine deaminase TadA
MPILRIEHPAWMAEVADPARSYEDDEARMRLAIALARESVRRGTGGPFGAAVFECASGALLAAGVNLVVPYANPILHAEVVALVDAHARRASYTLGAPGEPPCELVTSCEPCAMCLGALLWSGVRRVVWGALREDAMRIGFDEGPVFPESHHYLASRGIELVGGVCRDEAREVLERYARQGGVIYNGAAE